MLTFKFILFNIFVWGIRNYSRFKVIGCFWSVAVKIILSNYIKIVKCYYLCTIEKI